MTEGPPQVSVPEVPDSVLESGAPLAPPEANAPWILAEGKVLSELLNLVAGPQSLNGPCVWFLGKMDGGVPESVTAAAWIIAEEAIRSRGGQSRAFGVWRARAVGGPTLSAADRTLVSAFVSDAFGLPGAPANPELLQGLVAELLWAKVTADGGLPAVGRQLVHMEGPSFSVTEPGGDGLVVYGLEDGTLVFRLWEIKKHTSTAHLSRTVGRACVQLSSRGTAYLAKYVGIGRAYQGDLGALYAQLVDLWIESDPRAGLGISIGTSLGHAPKRRAFQGIVTRFPGLASREQREGLVLAVGDFPSFASLVQEYVWKGL